MKRLASSQLALELLSAGSLRFAMNPRAARDTRIRYSRPVILFIISALGLLNGAAGVVNMYQYLASNNSRQQLAITLLNITVFAFTLVYVSIRRERFKNFAEVTVSPSSR